MTAPLAVLRAVPGLRLRLLPGSDHCCGSAGIYSVLQPSMARAVLAAKIEAIAAADPRPAILATGNPGCLMQIGAGLLAAGLDIGWRTRSSCWIGATRLTFPGTSCYL